MRPSCASVTLLIASLPLPGNCIVGISFSLFMFHATNFPINNNVARDVKDMPHYWNESAHRYGARAYAWHCIADRLPPHAWQLVRIDDWQLECDSNSWTVALAAVSWHKQNIFNAATAAAVPCSTPNLPCGKMENLNKIYRRRKSGSINGFTTAIVSIH